jgi:hypothetical protein
MSSYRLKITRGCLIAGQPFEEGSIVELDLERACDTLGAGVAQPADDATAARLRSIPSFTWKRPAEEPERHLQRIH